MFSVVIHEFFIGIDVWPTIFDQGFAEETPEKAGILDSRTDTSYFPSLTSPATVMARLSLSSFRCEAITMSAPSPTPANTDRNLLFGILVLQMDFVSRDAFIGAM